MSEASSVPASNPDLLGRVRRWLGEQDVPYRHLAHEQATTTEALARVRGLAPDAGVKALLVKAGRQVLVVAVRVGVEVDNRYLRHALGTNRLRFLTPEELWDFARVLPGQVPPLGPPVLPAPLVADNSVLEGDVVAFTAGTHTDSIVMATADWRRVASPRLLGG